MFTWTAFDRLKYGLSRLTFGMATWRGFDAHKLAAETAVSGLTAVIIACRFPPGFGAGPSARPEWREVSVTLGDTMVVFQVVGRRKPYVVEVEAGTHRLRIAHDGPPPSFETTIEVADGQTLLMRYYRPASGAGDKSAVLGSASGAGATNWSLNTTSDPAQAGRA